MNWIDIKDIDAPHGSFILIKCDNGNKGVDYHVAEYNSNYGTLYTVMAGNTQYTCYLNIEPSTVIAYCLID